MKSLPTTDMSSLEYTLYIRAQDTNDEHLLEAVEGLMDLREQVDESESEKTLAIDEAKGKLESLRDELGNLGDALRDINKGTGVLEKLINEIADTLELE